MNSIAHILTTHRGMGPLKWYWCLWPFQQKNGDLNFHQNVTDYIFWERFPSCSLKRNIAGIFPTSFSSALLKSFVIWLIQRERLLVEAKGEGLQTCFKFRYGLSFILSSSYLLHYVYGFSVKCNQLIPPDCMNLIYIKQAEKSCWTRKASLTSLGEVYLFFLTIAQ